MCGRFIFIPKDELNSIIAAVKENLEKAKHINVSAQSHDVYPKAEDIPILIPSDNGLEIAAMKWGYERSWSKAPLFNTRADTAQRPPANGKPNMWANSLQHRRCIIPSYGFYEPHKSETYPSPKTGKPIKSQYRFNLPDSNILMMAGIYEDGYFSIMTTDPNRWMAPVHDRMPVVLRLEEVDTWLYGNYAALFDRSAIELRAEIA